MSQERRDYDLQRGSDVTILAKACGIKIETDQSKKLTLAFMEMMTPVVHARLVEEYWKGGGFRVILKNQGKRKVTLDVDIVASDGQPLLRHGPYNITLGR